MVNRNIVSMRKLLCSSLHLCSFEQMCCLWKLLYFQITKIFVVWKGFITVASIRIFAFACLLCNSGSTACLGLSKHHRKLEMIPKKTKCYLPENRYDAEIVLVQLNYLLSFSIWIPVFYLFADQVFQSKKKRKKKLRCFLIFMYVIWSSLSFLMDWKCK